MNGVRQWGRVLFRRQRWILYALLMLMLRYMNISMSIPIAPEGGSEHGSNGLNPDSSFRRTAYLITVNSTSPRTIRSIGILEGVGFDVELVFAPTNHTDKVVSNKLAQLTIYEQIIATHTDEEFGYIFEDDIILVGETKERFDEDKVNFTVSETVFELELEGTVGVYLGICGPARPSTAMPKHANRYCGKCAHAYGVSREGARLLLKYEKERQQMAYMDVLIQRLCGEVGGFPVSHVEKQSNQDEWHYGSFIQDRRTFKSLIS